jgi:hypothetical protein
MDEHNYRWWYQLSWCEFSLCCERSCAMSSTLTLQWRSWSSPQNRLLMGLTGLWHSLRTWFVFSKKRRFLSAVWPLLCREGPRGVGTNGFLCQLRPILRATLLSLVTMVGRRRTINILRWSTTIPYYRLLPLVEAASFFSLESVSCKRGGNPNPILHKE